MQTSWPGGSRQMAAIVPSWQQLPPQHATIQQPLLSDAGDWGRPLIVDSSAILQVRLLSHFFCIIIFFTLEKKTISTLLTIPRFPFKKRCLSSL